MKPNKVVAIVIMILSVLSIWIYGGALYNWLFPPKGLMVNCFAPYIDVCVVLIAMALVGVYISIRTYQSKMNYMTAVNIASILLFLGFLVLSIGF